MNVSRLASLLAFVVTFAMLSSCGDQSDEQKRTQGVPNSSEDKAASEVPPTPLPTKDPLPPNTDREPSPTGGSPETRKPASGSTPPRVVTNGDVEGAERDTHRPRKLAKKAGRRHTESKHTPDSKTHQPERDVLESTPPLPHAQDSARSPIPPLTTTRPADSIRVPASGTFDTSVAGEKRFAVVRTFFATDRKAEGKEGGKEIFGGGRALRLSYGFCEVSIPFRHRIGELESPSVLKFEFREDPESHVVLLKTATVERDDFFKQISQRANASTESNAFLFVHGYNVSFEDAARRTAQISYDLNFSGAPVFYSWPSQGKTGAYTVDEQNVEWAQANMLAFLEDFFQRSEAKNIYLIAHSMGNRALTRATIAFLNKNPDARSRLKEVILTAPDIDADVFKRDIAPALTASGRPVTLYASSDDAALLASKKVHGYARAGDLSRVLIVLPGMETVDATSLDTGFLGHSYFADNRSVLGDIFQLIKEGKKADERFGLKGVDAPVGRYWQFKR
jgi:esterase/lipase superfamily enzyme